MRRAEPWGWSELWRQGESDLLLADWSVRVPKDGLPLVNRGLASKALAGLEACVSRGRS